jgi:hypothetical protein
MPAYGALLELVDKANHTEFELRYACIHWEMYFVMTAPERRAGLAALFNEAVAHWHRMGATQSNIDRYVFPQSEDLRGRDDASFLAVPDTEGIIKMIGESSREDFTFEELLEIIREVNA